ncbi:MAG: iron-containing alcohol dehydrogenase [Nitrososphaerota archaeon]
MRDITTEIEGRLSGVGCSCHPVMPRTARALVTEGDAPQVLLEVLKELGLSGPVALAYDEVTYSVLASSIEGFLRSRGIEVVGFSVSRADEGNALRLKELMGRASVGVAVGGGTVIDVCKLAAHWSGKPFISVPTTLSHDGIASPVASVAFRGRSHRASVPATGPVAVVADAGVLSSSPRRLKAAGAGDLLAKLTALKDWELGELHAGEIVCRRAYAAELEAIECAIDFVYGGMRDALVLLKGLLLSGAAMALVGSSRPASGSEHMISHQIDALGKSKGLHGEQVALATVLMSRYHQSHNGGWWRDPRFSWGSVLELLSVAGAPTSFLELGLTREDVVEAVLRAPEVRPERVTLLHLKRPGRETVSELLEETGIC